MVIIKINILFQAQLKRLSAIKTSLLPLALVAVLMIAISSEAQPAKGANKYLGNITQRSAIRSDFLKYWNQITGENECKWSSIEGIRDRMNWSGADRIANYARQQGIPWKYHTLVWGSQCPAWINDLSQADQLKEVTQWFDSVAAHYPDVPMIDVVNEAYPTHAPAPFKNALGGDGATGFDWIIKAFQMARQRWPKAILIYNDFNNIEYNNEVNWTVKLITAMKAANAPVDAIGCQAHDAYKIPTATVKANLDKLAATGLPLIITEYDIGLTDANEAQKKSMEQQFTMFWTHPKIIGVTYWGYVVNQTWRDNTGLLNENGTERPALTWLVDYVKKNPSPPNDFPSMFRLGSVGTLQQQNEREPLTLATRNAALNNGQRVMKIFDLQGRVAGTVSLNNMNMPASSIRSQKAYIMQIDGRSAGTAVTVR